jgi:hypothetical protein
MHGFMNVKIWSTEKCIEETSLWALKIHGKYLNVMLILPKILQTCYLLSNIRRSIYFYTKQQRN